MRSRDNQACVRGIAQIRTQSMQQLCGFAGLAQGRARAAILWPGADWQALGLDAAILAPRPRYVLAGIGRVFERGPGDRPRHPSDAAVIDPTAELGEPAPRSAPSS